MSNVGKVFNLSGGGGSGSPKMESLTIATPPNKTVYKSGETFDPTGMVVVANYGEGLMANVTGYTVSPSVLHLHRGSHHEDRDGCRDGEKGACQHRHHHAASQDGLPVSGEP